MVSRFGACLTGALIALALTVAPVQAQDDLPPVPGASTNFEMRLSAVEDQLRALTGKTEQMEFSVRRLDQTLQKMQTDYEERLAKLETTPAPPPTPAPAPVATNNKPGTSAATTAEDGIIDTQTTVKGSLGDLKMQGDKVTGAVKNPKTPPLPETPPDYGLTPQEQYDKAFALLRQANYAEAEKSFKNFLDKNPKDKLLDNAKYWYAETFYVREQFKDAAIAFADAYQQNPKGTKAPDSLLKLAMALGSLEKKDDACSTLSSLKVKFPNAPATVRARADQEKAHLKCGKLDAATAPKTSE